MTSRPLGRRILLGALLALLPLGAPGGSERAGPVNLDYRVYWGGLHVADAGLALDRSQAGYSASLKGRAAGLLAAFTDARFDALAEGDGAGAALQPRLYRGLFERRNKRRLVEIQFDPEGLPQARVIDEHNRDRVTELPAALLRGSSDPLSAVMSLAAGIESAEHCAGKVRSYDGRRVLELSASHEGWTELKASRYSSYAGRALVCRIAIAALAGLEGGKTLEDKGIPRSVRVMLAPLTPAGGLLPVRVETQAELAPLRIHLTAVHPSG